MSMGEPGKPGKRGGPGEGGAGGEGGRGGKGKDPGGRGGPGGLGGAGGDLGGAPDYRDGRRRFRLLVMASLVLASFGVFMSAWLYARSVDARNQIATEATERRDQMCRLFEGQHLTDVTQLRRTYEFLESLPREEYGTNLTRAIVQGLGKQEQDARIDSAPPFCDEPGAEAEAHGAPPIGLPEPDPVPPLRRDFSRLLHRP